MAIGANELRNKVKLDVLTFFVIYVLMNVNT